MINNNFPCKECICLPACIHKIIIINKDIYIRELYDCKLIKDYLFKNLELFNKRYENPLNFFKKIVLK